MKELTGIGFLLAVALTLASCQSNTQTSAPAAAPSAAEVAPPLVLTATVPLEGVKGRFDHFASGKGKVFVSGLGNNSVEIIDLFQGARAHEITGVPNPQGVAFSPEANKLFVPAKKARSTSTMAIRTNSSPPSTSMAARTMCATTPRTSASTSAAAMEKRMRQSQPSMR
jgi:hypothetical protein